MARLSDPIDSLGPEAQKVYDKIVAKRGALRGPFAPLLHHPALTEPVADLGEFLRFRSTLPGDVRELAILVVGRTVGAPFEWWAHAPIAQREGVPEAVIERVRARGDLTTLPDRYAGAVRVVQHVLAHESLPPALQASVERQFGLPGVIELVVLAGYYRMIAGVLISFDVPLPEGATPAF